MVMGEHAEGIFGRSHVEDVQHDGGPFLGGEAAGEAASHIICYVDFTGAVDIVEDGFRVKDPVSRLGGPLSHPVGQDAGQHLGRVCETFPCHQERQTSRGKEQEEDDQFFFHRVVRDHGAFIPDTGIIDQPAVLIKKTEVSRITGVQDFKG